MNKPSTSQSTPASRKRAWVALGVYALSLLVYPGAMAFALGFRSAVSPFIGLPGSVAPPGPKAQGGPGGDVIATGMLGLAWLANPLIVVGMFLLGKGARSGATMAGTASLLLALCAAPLAVFMPLALPTFVLWLASMVLVLHGANRKEPPVEVEEAAQNLSQAIRTGTAGLGDEKYSWIAVGLYASSYLALMLVPRFRADRPGEGLLAGLSMIVWWASGPIGLTSMYMFATKSWRRAAIAGSVALVLALGGFPFFAISP
jgi:hypothetical protein